VLTPPPPRTQLNNNSNHEQHNCSYTSSSPPDSPKTGESGLFSPCYETNRVVTQNGVSPNFSSVSSPPPSSPESQLSPNVIPPVPVAFHPNKTETAVPPRTNHKFY
jgi:hypothetical protein